MVDAPRIVDILNTKLSFDVNGNFTGLAAK